MVSAKELTDFLRENERPFCKLSLSAGDPGPVPVTKLAGVPWWPAGVERPRCVDGHLMDFIAQVRLDEVPSLDWPQALLSFHYCHQCSYDGNMAFGLSDSGQQQRYDVRVFSDLEAANDDVGVVAKPVVEPMTAALQEGRESMGISDIWEAFPETGQPGGIPRSVDVNIEEGTKIGGWPNWVQACQWPEEEIGEPMEFVGQLDYNACSQSAWANGCAYLFVSPPDEDEILAELLLQHT